MTELRRIGLPSPRPGDGTIADQRSAPFHVPAEVLADVPTVDLVRPAPQNVFPIIDPVPWYTAAARIVREARARITEAAWVLAHGVEEDE